MKNVLIINASIRKRSTYSLLKRIESHLSHFQVEFINIKDYDIKPCTGCENCMRKGTCIIKDEAKLILEKISLADGIIFGSPVYLRQLSGYLKVLFDRGCSWYHRSPLVGKPVFFVTSTQVTGSKATIKYLNDLSVQWGTINAGHISRNMFNIEKKIERKSLDKFKYYIDDANKRKYKPTFKQIVEFSTQKVLAVNVLPLDKEYWEEKSYINQPYFYDCQINIFKRLTGGVYYNILNHFISKNKN